MLVAELITKDGSDATTDVEARFVSSGIDLEKYTKLSPSAQPSYWGREKLGCGQRSGTGHDVGSQEAIQNIAPVCFKNIFGPDLPVPAAGCLVDTSCFNIQL